MDSTRLGSVVFLFALSTFAALLTQHVGWICAAVVGALVLGREVGQRTSIKENAG